MKDVFDTRPDTGYNDDIIRRYHFPNLYTSPRRERASATGWCIANLDEEAAVKGMSPSQG